VSPAGPNTRTNVCAHCLSTGTIEAVDETIALVDPATGDIIAEGSKTQAHIDGTWHATIHVWILDDKNRLILQRRSPTKEHFPNFFDVSVGGHIRPGEDGLREVEEELGVTVTLGELISIGTLTLETKIPTLWTRERPRVYLWYSKLSLDSFKFTDGEVSQLAAIEIRDLAPLLHDVTIACDIFDGAEVTKGMLSYAQLSPFSTEYWNTLLKALRSVPRIL
jgi:isopentenyl-diphosphate Delta-isomerase